MFLQAGNGTAAASEGSDYSEDQDSPKIQKPFFRRLSFKGLRKGKVINFMVIIKDKLQSLQ